MGKPKPNPAQVHRESVTEAPVARTAEPAEVHDTGGLRSVAASVRRGRQGRDELMETDLQTPSVPPRHPGGRTCALVLGVPVAAVAGFIALIHTRKTH